MRDLRCLLAVAALVAGCSSGGAATPAPPAPALARVVSGGLAPYADCRQLLQRVRREGLAQTTAYGLGPQVYRLLGGNLTSATDRAAAGPAFAESLQKSVSGTTVQEKGVDELDRVKTDGRLLAVVDRSVLRLYDVSGDGPERRGTLSLRADLSDPQLLLVGGDLVVVGTRYGGSHPVTQVRVVDTQDLASPAVVREYDVQGTLLDARTVRGRVLLATSDTPTIEVARLTTGSAADQRHALLVNRRRVAAATEDQWLPSVTAYPSGTVTRASCSQVLHPALPSGVGTTQLVTLDPDRDAPTETVTVTGGNAQLYASPDAVYLATSAWSRTAFGGPVPTPPTTDLHGIDVTDPDHYENLGSGSVPGTLLDRYALSESGGVLRVATTAGDGTGGRVTMLRPSDGRLEQLGVVEGLGKGERIVGVRFLGDVAYVVTFRSIDPLFVVDLADPAHPRARGSLELPGFSSTLFPLGKDRLLGIGPAGGRGGTQLSVFDVHDLDAPALLSRLELPGGYSPAAQDHHALLWWEPSSLVVLPVTGSGGQSARAYRLDDKGLAEVSSWTAPAPQPMDRSAVVGDLVYSVGTAGILTHRLDDLGKQVQWLPFV